MYEKQEKYELMSIASHFPYFSYNKFYKIQDKIILQTNDFST